MTIKFHKKLVRTPGFPWFLREISAFTQQNSDLIGVLLSYSSSASVVVSTLDSWSEIPGLNPTFAKLCSLFKIWFLWSKFALSHKNLGKFLIIVSIFWHFRGPKSTKIEHTCVSNMYRMFRHKNIENEKFQECIPFVLCALCSQKT